MFYSLIGSRPFHCPITSFYTFHIRIKPGFHSSQTRLKHVFFWFWPKVTSWKHQKSVQITNNSHHAWCQAWLPWKHGCPDWFPLFFLVQPQLSLHFSSVFFQAFLLGLDYELKSVQGMYFYVSIETNNFFFAETVMIDAWMFEK